MHNNNFKSYLDPFRVPSELNSLPSPLSVFLVQLIERYDSYVPAVVEDQDSQQFYLIWIYTCKNNPPSSLSPHPKNSWYAYPAQTTFFWSHKKLSTVEMNIFKTNNAVQKNAPVSYKCSKKITEQYGYFFCM